MLLSHAVGARLPTWTAQWVMGSRAEAPAATVFLWGLVVVGRVTHSRRLLVVHRMVRGLVVRGIYRNVCRRMGSLPWSLGKLRWWVWCRDRSWGSHVRRWVRGWGAVAPRSCTSAPPWELLLLSMVLGGREVGVVLLQLQQLGLCCLLGLHSLLGCLRLVSLRTLSMLLHVEGLGVGEGGRRSAGRVALRDPFGGRRAKLHVLWVEGVGWVGACSRVMLVLGVPHVGPDARLLQVGVGLWGIVRLVRVTGSCVLCLSLLGHPQLLGGEVTLRTPQRGCPSSRATQLSILNRLRDASLRVVWLHEALRYSTHHGGYRHHRSSWRRVWQWSHGSR
mmetsp:Transcript_19422/g.25091  ORF Transcript_19422/g.25091 Transcript_19422/m.25091 type:complete len:333 (+) Transcript_19422:384-1382(+)